MGLFDCFNEIEVLKNRARKHYHAYYNELDTLSCGAALGEHVNPRLLSAKVEFNKTMDELAKIDSTTPRGRL